MVHWSSLEFSRAAGPVHGWLPKEALVYPKSNEVLKGKKYSEILNAFQDFPVHGALKGFLQ